MRRELKRRVCQANLDLVREGLVVHTFGNVSGIDRSRGLVVIKPSGVPYAEMTPASMVTVSLETGRVVDSGLRPSSDTPTHLELYRAFSAVGGVVHTHSLHATAWAQAVAEIPVLGTTHADYFDGPVPCTRLMDAEEVRHGYEANTGRVIVERFRGIEPLKRPAVLVANHGPFAWGSNPEDAVHAASILEFLARLASETLRISPGVPSIAAELHEKHFSRKHGPSAYYGQRQPSPPRSGP